MTFKYKNDIIPYVKVNSSPTTQLVSEILLSDGRTLSYEYDAEERITSVTESYKTADNKTITNVTEYLCY